MRRFLAIFLLCCLLAGCSLPQPVTQKQYNASFLDLFDTVTRITGLAESKEAFQETAQAIQTGLREYHQLFDIYKEYPGVVNLKTVNDNAGIAPVQVDARILDLLEDCLRYYELTGGKVNVAMGSVLRLWHEARQAAMDDPANAAIPDKEALEQAQKHTDITKLVIDREKGTVYLSDPEMALDVGAVAKGWAAQRVCDQLPDGLLVSVGGNVVATGPKNAEGSPWSVGIQNPEGDGYLHTLSIASGSVVTSGDYQRYFVADGKVYHHIIDPQTLLPGSLWRSVTILCEDSGLADALSTALFLLPKAEGEALLKSCGASAMWLDAQGNRYYSEGFESHIRT